MAESTIKLYTRGQSADSAFFLEEGRVLFFQNNVDRYTISGKKLIIGATELIVNHISGAPTDRMESALALEGADIKKISLDSFKRGLTSFPFIINTSAILAKQIALTNNIIGRSLVEQDGDDVKLKDVSIEYYLMVDRLREAYRIRKFPWLLPIINGEQGNLCYKRGEAYYRSNEFLRVGETVQLSERMVEYPRGSVICEQGTHGTEMYIVQRGAIDVMVNGVVVTSIEDRGSIIGEMAMLLGETRSATLVAKNSVVLTKVSKDDMLKLAAKDLKLPLAIMKSLAKRHYYNIIKIGDIASRTVQKMIADEERGREANITMAENINETEKLIDRLKDKINRLYTEQKQDFLKDILKESAVKARI